MESHFFGTPCVLYRKVFVLQIKLWIPSFLWIMPQPSSMFVAREIKQKVRRIFFWTPCSPSIVAEKIFTGQIIASQKVTVGRLVVGGRGGNLLFSLVPSWINVEDQPESERSFLCKSRLSLASRCTRLSFSSKSSFILAIFLSLETISEEAILSLAVSSSILFKCEQQLSPNSLGLAELPASSPPLCIPAETSDEEIFFTKTQYHGFFRFNTRVFCQAQISVDFNFN